MRILVLHNSVPGSAAPDEMDNVIEAESVTQVLDCLGHTTEKLPFENSEETIGRIKVFGPDVVFNLVETVGGTGRLCHLAPQALERAGIQFTGCGTEAIHLSTSKLLSKQRLHATGINTPGWIQADGQNTAARFPASYIIKPEWEEASVGIDDEALTTVDSPENAKAAIAARAARLGVDCFAEEFIDGREINVSIIETHEGPLVLPIAEIRFIDWGVGRPKIVGYKAKWDESSFEYKNSVRSYEFSAEDSALLATCKDSALAVWNAFSLRGYARVDMRASSDGALYVLELNTNPCISPDAGLAIAAQRAGISYAELIERILKAALRAGN